MNERKRIVVRIIVFLVVCLYSFIYEKGFSQINTGNIIVDDFAKPIVFTGFAKNMPLQLDLYLFGYISPATIYAGLSIELNFNIVAIDIGANAILDINNMMGSYSSTNIGYINIVNILSIFSTKIMYKISENSSQSTYRYEVMNRFQHLNKYSYEEYKYLNGSVTIPGYNVTYLTLFLDKGLTGIGIDWRHIEAFGIGQYDTSIFKTDFIFKTYLNLSRSSLGIGADFNLRRDIMILDVDVFGEISLSYAGFGGSLSMGFAFDLGKHNNDGEYTLLYN